MINFAECAACSVKPGAPDLCPACLHNRATIHHLHAALEAALDSWEILSDPGSLDRQQISALRERFDLLPRDVDDATAISSLTSEILTFARRITARTRNTIQNIRTYRKKWRE